MNTIWILAWIIALVIIAYLTIRLFIRDRRFRIVAKALANAYNDLTEANREIRQHAERKSAFLASMSHELRTPITAIKGYVDNMRDGFAGELTEKQRHNLNRVSQNTSHLLTLIDNLLDLSKIEAGHMEVHATHFNIEHMATQCLSIVGSLVKNGVTLSCDVSPEIGQICTDEMRLRQILINLLGNAIKFTAMGEVKVTCKRLEVGDGRLVGKGDESLQRSNVPTFQRSNAILQTMDDGKKGESLQRSNVPTFQRSNAILVITISDTGKGISKDDLPMIFDEYRQAKRNESSVQKSTGLGLSITKKFAELLGGTIAVTSEVGKGTMFTVKIPLMYKA